MPQAIFVWGLFLVLFICFYMGQKVNSVIPFCYIDAMLRDSLKKSFVVELNLQFSNLHPYVYSTYCTNHEF